MCFHQLSTVINNLFSHFWEPTQEIFIFRFLNVKKRSRLIENHLKKQFTRYNRCLAEIRWSVCVSKSQRSLCISFSGMDSELCVYHLFVWSYYHYTPYKHKYWKPHKNFLTQSFSLKFMKDFPLFFFYIDIMFLS